MTVSTPQASTIRQTFARHETFHPRFGWLKKGFDQAAKDPTIFLQDDATVRLGVGKNMVRSIRYWCSAFKLLESDCPTEFGNQLLGSTGWAVSGRSSFPLAAALETTRNSLLRNDVGFCIQSISRRGVYI